RSHWSACIAMLLAPRDGRRLQRRTRPGTGSKGAGPDKSSPSDRVPGNQFWLTSRSQERLRHKIVMFGQSHITFGGAICSRKTVTVSNRLWNFDAVTA